MSDQPPSYPSYPGSGDDPSRDPRDPGRAPEQPGQVQGQEAAYGAPYGSPYGYGASGSTDPDRRPGTVTAACAITWVLAGISALLFGFSLVAMLVAQDEIIDVIREQPGFEDAGMSADAAAGVVTAVMAVFLVWALVAVLLAVGAFRRSNVARIALVVSAVISAILSLLAITSLVSLVTLVGSVAAVVLLFVGGANEWFSRRGTADHGYGDAAPYGR